MKRIILMAVVFLTAMNYANAQLTVYSNGNVGIATPSSSDTESTLSVKGGMTGFDASVKGDQRGIYGLSNGQYLGWSHAIYGKSNCNSASFQNGVMGKAVINTPQSSSRTYGVMGLAGNATNGWNYGVFGQLDGTNNGAGIYGTATNGENGSCVDGRYAGYFNGATKVKGNLTVTGSISGILLNQTSNVSMVSTLSEEFDGATITDKLARLSTTCFYTEASIEGVSAIDNSSDSISVGAPINEIQALSAERLHYGLDIEQLKESFPELIYEQDNGTIGINYIEMIPILIHAVKNLSEEVKTLRASSKNPYSERSESSTTSVMLSPDGRILGTKRSLSK